MVDSCRCAQYLAAVYLGGGSSGVRPMKHSNAHVLTRNTRTRREFSRRKKNQEKN